MLLILRYLYFDGGKHWEVQSQQGLMISLSGQYHCPQDMHPLILVQSRLLS